MSTPSVERPETRRHRGSLRSAFFEGTVRHRRSLPESHTFEYRTFLVYLDLEELPQALDRLPLWSARRLAPAMFRRSDYLGDPDRPLIEAIRDLVEERLGTRPQGPVRMLAHLRYFGFCFNPVTFYYCFDPQGRRVETIVAEIENTPWGERHAYVLPARGEGSLHRFRFPKAFHVSPFQDMDLEYDWRFLEPEETLAVHMVSWERGRRSFDATLALKRRPFTARNGLRFLGSYPLITLQVITAIYWQALRLRLKGFRFFPHPSKRRADPGTRAASHAAPKGNGSGGGSKEAISA